MTISHLLQNTLCIPLTNIFNKLLEIGIVLDLLKLAKIIPIYKSKNKELLNNYRPISLLPTVSKLLEKIVHTKLYNFINTHAAFYPKPVWIPEKTLYCMCSS